MAGYDLLFCEMPFPDAELGPETVFGTRAFDGVFNDIYRITADGRLIGPLEQVLSYPPQPGEPVRQVAATDWATGGTPLAWNGDIEFWSETHPPRVFFACFVDGRCARILPENDYRSLMEKGRRWALLSPAG